MLSNMTAFALLDLNLEPTNMQTILKVWPGGTPTTPQCGEVATQGCSACVGHRIARARGLLDKGGGTDCALCLRRWHICSAATH